MRNKALILAAAAAALLAGCSSGGDTSETAQAQPSNFRLTAAQRQHIRIETVAPASFRPTIVAPGTVDYDNDQATVVTSQFTGPLTRLLVALGQHVAKGQPIALVQSADYATAVGTRHERALCEGIID